ncbi:WD repeat-containing protein jip5 [Saitozyma podzolica]|uniref:WD repeat-containing protein n=1 Tax=Saitozyma podzolica TaxID=1890683 RepID=A0A427YEI3_9TREE|nr:WD repeat-containing protein jip5 [Saitozyma podzolica]
MPDIKLRNQPFDLAFHPSQPVLVAALLTGEIKAFRYDDETGDASSSWSIRPTKRTARALSAEEQGDSVWMGGKAGGLFQIDIASGSIKSERLEAHEVPINRLFCVNENLVATGDDDGVIKFWDPRQQESIRSYSQHFDYISDFAYFDDKRQLISTSGDGHLSAIDIRSSKASPLAVSDDQEDELLSITAIKGGTRCVVGSGLGILSVWDRKKGWGDWHPASIDAVLALTDDVIASGSEDGMIRVMQILPNKFLGVITTHEEYPIERIRLDRRRKWLGSVSHDDCIKLTDVEDLFDESDDDDMEEEAAEGVEESEADDDMEAEEASSDEEMDTAKSKKGRKGRGMGDMTRPHHKEDDNFFGGL